MSRRRMMMGRQVVNLFDKNSSEIVFRARLNTSGQAFGPGAGNNIDEVEANSAFISDFVRVEPGQSYVLIRKQISESSTAYNRYCFYGISKKYHKSVETFGDVLTIIIPENCYYIRFSGLIEDIDNVKFYKA